MSLWESRVPSCPFGPLWGRFHIPFFGGGVQCPFGVSHIPLGGLMSLWGSRVPYCPFGPFGVSRIPLGEVPYPFGGFYVPSCPLGPCWGGSYVPYRVLCPLPSLRSLWSVPHPFWGGVPHPFGGPVSPPIP